LGAKAPKTFIKAIMSKINIAFDLDGTIDKNPEFYKELMKIWEGKRYIITGRPQTESILTLIQLLELGIVSGKHYDYLIMYPEPYLWMNTSHCSYGFFHDDSDTIFNTMKHRDEHIASFKNPPKQYDHAKFTIKIAEWKVKKCKDFDISIVFDDNDTNVEKLISNGIYALKANIGFKNA
jgi:hypothetical protein